MKFEHKRVTDHKLEQIDELIMKADSEEKKSYLLILQCITSSIISSTKVMEDMVNKLEKHDGQIERHNAIVIKASATWTAITTAFTILQSALLVAALYGYTVVADLRDTVNRQSEILPRLEELISASKQQTSVSMQTRETLAHSLGTSQQQQEIIDKLNTEISSIKKLKVVKGSK